jgi:hypothetical protein
MTMATCNQSTAKEFLRRVPKSWRAPIAGGFADGWSIDGFNKDSLAQGLCVELEHTSCWWTALRIAMDHILEHPGYYAALEKMESKLSRSEAHRRKLASILATEAVVDVAEGVALLAVNPSVVHSGRKSEGTRKMASKKKSHKDVEFAVSSEDGREVQRYFSTSGEASENAVAMSMSTGEAAVIDVIVSSKAGAKWYGGDYAVEIYEDDPDASVHERIIVRAESLGHVY